MELRTLTRIRGKSKFSLAFKEVEQQQHQQQVSLRTSLARSLTSMQCPSCVVAGLQQHGARPGKIHVVCVSRVRATLFGFVSGIGCVPGQAAHKSHRSCTPYACACLVSAKSLLSLSLSPSLEPNVCAVSIALTRSSSLALAPDCLAD